MAIRQQGPQMGLLVADQQLPAAVVKDPHSTLESLPPTEMTSLIHRVLHKE
jgi:hypothetical protein